MSSSLSPAQGVFDHTRPLGVYVHVPFCSVRCPYCDFAVDDRADIPHDRYADAVTKEIAARAPWFWGPQRQRPDLRSIYFGGGTPGLWRPDALARTIEAARVALDVVDLGALEITVEANPGEVTSEGLEAWRRAGVNRLSFGVQSFDDALLRGIGRNHDAAAIPRAMLWARQAGFANITCDLMFGLPAQTLATWLHSVESLVALSPDHLSCYALTIERGTAFGALDRKRRLPRPDDDLVASMFEAGRAALAAAGYAQYEVSSYARPGHRAVHNHLYWTAGAYLGVGCSASSFRPLEDGTAFRFTNARATETYLRAVEVSGGAPTPADLELRQASDLENEFLWLGLRTSDGIDRARHKRRHGHDPLAVPGREAACRKVVEKGWLEVTPDHLRLTPEGFLFADEVASRLWSS